MMSSRPIIVKAWCPNFDFNSEGVVINSSMAQTPKLAAKLLGQGLIKQN